MADWKQITARIRRAKGSKDPAGQLCNLFQKTRDAMVAFELARHLETASLSEEAVKWYAISWQRFRRGDWKTKAQDAVTRLGGALPAEGEILPVPEVPRLEAQESPPLSAASESVPEAEDSPDSQTAVEQSAGNSSEFHESASSGASASAKRTRRRGRRGGRNRRKTAAVTETPASSAAPHPHAKPATTHDEISPPRIVDSRSIPRIPVEPAPDSASGGMVGVKGRFGDPGLSSRISLLEMQFRRLLTCPSAKLDQADRAPAGPGVFVLTDEEMTTYYYVEACDTLRIAIANISRGGNRRSGISIKPLLADHLGIPEARVGKYLTEHCVVRWLQLDEGAEYFAHFVIAILRPILNSPS
jgi:hypothetical protein